MLPESTQWMVRYRVDKLHAASPLYMAMDAALRPGVRVRARHDTRGSLQRKAVASVLWYARHHHRGNRAAWQHIMRGI